jgi:drug/metabolite transporter (DMT)-like permease
MAALGSAFCFAAYVVLTRRLEAEPVMTRLFHSALWVWLSLSAAMPFVWQRPSWQGLAAMVAIGLAGWVLLYALDLAVDEVPAGILAPFFYTQIFWMAIMDGVRRGSVPGMQKVAGVVLIGASLLVVIAGLRRSGEQAWTASNSTPSSSA